MGMGDGEVRMLGVWGPGRGDAAFGMCSGCLRMLGEVIA